jgi:outer membrane lipoprotein carrier protein
VKNELAVFSAAACIVLFFVPSRCVADEASQAVKRFEKTYRSASTLSATFLEKYSESGDVVRTEAGTAYFKRPGKMRWEYNSPEKNLFLVDGKTAWFYVPADRTVTRMPAKQSEDWRTPLALLAGEAKISRICSKVGLAKPPSNDPNLIALRCDLKGAEKTQAGSDDEAMGPGSSPDFVRIELARRNGELKSVVVHDRGGVIVEFQFANWEFNPPVPEASFHFAPPMGVAIVNGVTGSASDGQSLH